MKNTPKGMRLHIGIFGKRNVGKSSLMNALTNQNVSIVSSESGTTTDPVEKPMELQPIGPVQFIDTAGLDDVGMLGELRMKKTGNAIERTDLAIIVTTSADWDSFEQDLVNQLKNLKTPVIIVVNKTDIDPVSKEITQYAKRNDLHCLAISAIQSDGLDQLRQSIMEHAPDIVHRIDTIVGDLIPPGELVILVVPIDLEAPKGRLILPQVQTIRDILDHDSYCMVVKERELRDALDRLKRPPALVVTDSQAFLKVSGDTPSDIPLTSFSILFARLKGDLQEFVKGAMAIDNLKPGDRVLIAEACSHHPVGEDIGTVKIPRWLTNYVGGKLDFEYIHGHDFPSDISPYKLVIHCGACTFNPRLMKTRIERCRQAGVAITNYGVSIAYTLGIFQRALTLFPAAQQEYQSHLAY